MQVDWRQNVTFYLALRRLKSKLHCYYIPTNTILWKSCRRLDLRIRLEQWFAHYLKDESPS